MPRLPICTASMIAATVMMADGAIAADLYTPVAPEAPVITSEPSPWMIRLRAIGVIPDEGATLRTGGATIAGATVGIDDSVVPELDITYFFNDYLAAELILATTPHTVTAAGSAAALGNLTDAWLLPPTLLAQVHLPLTDTIKPYVGAGVNYTFFYAIDEAAGIANVDIDNNFGWALQAGVDFMIDEHWGINVDVKKIFLETDATITTTAGAVINADIDIDPWIIGGGVVYRF